MLHISEKLRRERAREGLTEAILTDGMLLIKWPSASAVLGRPKTDAYPHGRAAESSCSLMCFP